MNKMRIMKAALLVAVFVFGAAIAQLLVPPKYPDIKGHVAIGDTAYWYLLWTPEGVGPIKTDTTIAGDAIVGEPCGARVRDDYYTLPRLRKNDGLGGNIAITRCVAF